MKNGARRQVVPSFVPWFVSLKTLIRCVRMSCAVVILAGMVWDVRSVGQEARVVIKRSVGAGELSGSLSASGVLHLNSDAAIRRQLRESRAKIDAGQFAEGLTSLQRILDRGDDGFVRLQNGGELTSVRLEALAIFSALPPAGLATAEKLFGSQARQLFERARERGHAIEVAEVVRRFFHTQAGFDAASWQAGRLLDQGEAIAAARLLDRILTESAHRSRVRPELRFQAAVAHRLSGHEDRVTELLGQIGADTVAITGQARTSDQLAELLPPMRSRVSAASSRDWIGPAGQASRNANGVGSVPWLNPRWTLPLFGHPDQAGLVIDWLGRQQGQVPMRLTFAHEPLVVGDIVVMRSSANVQAIDLPTGRVLWRHRSSLSHPELMQRAALGATGWGFDVAVEKAFVGNVARGTLSSDGRLVFAIDEVPFQGDPSAKVRTVKPDDLFDDLSQMERPRVLTQLVALSLVGASSEGQDSRPVWIADGPTVGAKIAGVGHAIQFLGPPTVFDGHLFAIGELFSLSNFDSEKVGQLSLLAFDPRNGELLWSQGLALVDQPFFRSEQGFRGNPVGVPSAADGMLVCPTELGLVFGIDLASSRQRWVYDTRGVATDNRRAATGESPGCEGSPVWPVIHRGCVLLMPRDSDDLHCLDLESGQLLWRTPRKDAVVIGAVTDEIIVLVGDRDARAIPFSRIGPTDGREIPSVWTQQLGHVTGRGVRVGDNFLVPLKSGRIASLDIATGRELGFSLRRTIEVAEDTNRSLSHNQQAVTWPGNLVVAKDLILAMGPTQLVAYPQAQVELANIPPAANSVEHKLLRAELSMLLEMRGSSVEELQQIVEQPLSPKLRQQADRQLRESLFLELDRRPERAGEYLLVLERLANSSSERARLLRRSCEFWMPTAPERAVRAAKELVSLPLEQEFDLDERGQHVVSKETWARGILRQVRHRTHNNPEQSDPLLDLLNQERDQLLTTNDIPSLRRFVSLCEEWPQAIPVRFHLAKLLIDRGEWQEAELLLLQPRQSSDVRIAAVATTLLLRLWNAVGLHAQAASLLSELNERFAETPIALASSKLRSATGREFVEQFPRDSLTWQAFARLRKPSWNIRRVEITEDRQLVGSSRLTESFEQSTKPPLRTPPGCAVALFEKYPAFQSNSEPAWHVIDKDSGTLLGQLLGMERVWYPSSQTTWSAAHSGHLLPLGGLGRMRAVSLLERDGSRCSWEQPIAALTASEEFPRVGPSGHNFLTFQTRQHLIVADPSSGRVLWQRSQLEPHSGLFAENEWGLFGDAEALVLFGQDSLSYTVLETATGRELRRGSLNVDTHQNRRAFGRRLFYFAQEKVADLKLGNGRFRMERRLRIWDPLTDRFEWDEPFTDRANWSTTADGELLIVQSSGRIRVLDVSAQKIQLDVMLPSTATVGVSQVRAFSDRERYFVNVQRGLSDQSLARFNYYANEILLPKSDVQGELYAFKRPVQSVAFDEPHGSLGQQLWLRHFLQRSFLRLEAARLPFLIAAAKQQDQKINTRVSLRLDAIDADTGIVIGSHDHLPLGRIVQTQFDNEIGELRLLGLQTAVRIHFDRTRQRIATTDEPL